MEARHAFIFLVFGFCLIVGTNGFCDRTLELQNCMNVLLPGVNIKEIAGSSPSWNRTQLEHVCGSVDKFFTCYDGFVERCHDTELGKIRHVLSTTFSYMCGKGRELYLKNRVCLSKSDITNKIHACTHHHFGVSHTTDEACDKIKTLTNCAKNAVSDCGEDAKQYIAGFVKEVTYGQINCGDQSHGMLMAIIGAVVVTVALIAVVIGALMKRRNNVPFEKMENC